MTGAAEVFGLAERNDRGRLTRAKNLGLEIRTGGCTTEEFGTLPAGEKKYYMTSTIHAVE
jgi:hypothetical protein